MPPSRKGEAPGAASDDDDAATAPLSGRDAQWQAGVRRQALPDARQHQVNASQAAAAKRSAEAMPEEERKAKHRTHATEVRERQRAERAAAAAAAAAPAAAAASVVEPATAEPPPTQAMPPVVQEREEQDLDALAFAVSDDEHERGYDDDDQKRAHMVAADAWAQDAAAQDAAWETERPRREKERERADSEQQEDRANASEPIWAQHDADGSWSLFTRGEIADHRDSGLLCGFQAYTGDLEAAAAYLQDPDSDESEAWLEAQLAPGGGGPPPPPPPSSEDCYYEGYADADRGVFPPGHPHEGEPVKRPREEWLASLSAGEREHYELIAPQPICDATGKVVLIEELDPEGYFPICYFPGDVGRALARNYSDRSSFYAWVERSAQPQDHVTTKVSATSAAAPIPNPPKRSDFPRGRDPVGKAGREAFQRERKKWFKLATRCPEHPDGVELDGSLAEQNTRYDIIARRFRTYSDGRSHEP